MLCPKCKKLVPVNEAVAYGKCEDCVKQPMTVTRPPRSEPVKLFDNIGKRLTRE